MKHVVQALVLIMDFGMFSSCTVTSHTDKVLDVDFSKYQSFAWIDSARSTGLHSSNSILDQNIRSATRKEMTMKGLREQHSNPDLYIDYSVSVESSVRRSSDPVYSYPYTQYIYTRRGVVPIWYPSMYMGSRTYQTKVKEGTIRIQLYDAKTNKMIWQGWANSELNGNTMTSKDALTQIKAIFKKFDYSG
ncbi:MAG: DUF4136 domain-containing protein [Chitinophagaceae bacterium]|nr:DUF4136 domain-containing protein [Chitinophagaceae bacterium]